jgi:hypothetical protein
MGDWGPGLFAGDCALDIRGMLRDCIGDGMTAAKAEAAILKDFRPSLRSDPDDYAVIWLAIAMTEWSLGRLTPRAKRKALDVLEREIGLDIWAESGLKLLAARRKSYGVIRRQLQKPQPPAKHVPKRHRSETDWKPGHLVAYRCLSGKEIYLRVLDLFSDNGGTYVHADIMKWRLKRRPTRSEAQTAARFASRFATLPQFRDWTNFSTMSLYSRAKKDFPHERVELIETGLRFRFDKHGAGGTVFGGWKKLDTHLRTEYKIQ